MKSKKSTCKHLLIVFIFAPLLMISGCSPQYVEQPSGVGDPHSVETADELLVELETQADWFEEIHHRTSNLSNAELKIASAALREKYPVESLRDRMHFQTIHPAPVMRTPTGEGRGYDDGFFSQRSRALAELHSDEVYRFINRNGQGFMRSPPPQPSDLRLWGDYASRIQGVDVDSNILGEAIVQLPAMPTDEDGKRFQFNHPEYRLSENGMPRQEMVDDLHLLTSNRFASPESLGFVESVDRVAGFDSHRVRLPNAWLETLWQDKSLEQQPDSSWSINQLQLVGLLIHEEPVVYESEQLPNMEELSGADAKTRRLNAFEDGSLTKLQLGEDLVTVATHNRLLMLGALRADTSCLECHSVKENDLLGAFSYEILRSPAEQEPKTSNPTF